MILELMILLLENQKISLCGEESFGAGSFHVMEKDGLWAILCWLNILALTKKTPKELVMNMWKRHGRIDNHTINCTPDSATNAKHLMDSLSAKLISIINQKVGDLTISEARFFNYTDPVSQIQSTNQGILIDFGPNDQAMIRLSGTVSSGATVKIYLHHKDKKATLSADEAIAPIFKAIQNVLDIPKYLGKNVQLTQT